MCIGLILLSAILAVCPETKQDAQEKVTQGQVQKWLDDLDASAFQVREEASRALVQHGGSHLLLIVDHALSGTAETRWRVTDIIFRTARSTDYTSVSQLVDQLERLVQSDNPDHAAFARELHERIGPVGSREDLELLTKFRQLVAEAAVQRQQGTKHPDVVTQAFVDQLVQKHGYRLIAGNSTKEGDWHDQKDPETHQELLVYRVRWFNGGWSRWFIPGVNDFDTKIEGGRMWRYFFDHAFERVEIPFRFGPLAQRQNYMQLSEPASGDGS